MIIFNNQKELKEHLSKVKNSLIGFVPTMGALHQGHISLISKSKALCDITVCSIYVNPKQFNKSDDFLNYPKKIKDDIKLLEKNNCNILYSPEDIDLHFNGMATIVEKLLNIVKPQMVFFGEKDLQQLMIIKELVKQNNISTKVIGCPIIREKNGLAKSSRNQHLSKTDRESCGIIYKQLLLFNNLFKKTDLEVLKKQIITNITSNKKIEIEYLEFVNLDTFQIENDIKNNMNYACCIAVSISGVRLIDNIIL